VTIPAESFRQVGPISYRYKLSLISRIHSPLYAPPPNLTFKSEVIGFIPQIRPQSSIPIPTYFSFIIPATYLPEKQDYDKLRFERVTIT